MYIVTVGHTEGKKYLKMWVEGKEAKWEWVHKFNQATRFTRYKEANAAMKLAVTYDRICDATIYGYM